jgi:hypothetical protein
MPTSSVMQESYTSYVDASSKDLLVKFGIKAPQYTSHTAADVTTGFNALHAYINDVTKFTTSTTDSANNLVRLGDYIDLPSLTVVANDGGGTINASNTALSGHGTLLRMVVVGINSFNRRSAPPSGYKATPHVVFQFQNVIASHAMNSQNEVIGGYEATLMRKYLVPTGAEGSGNFITGLKNAGVPASVMWGPKRSISKGGGDTAGTACNVIEDLVWLPTEREVFKSNTYSPTSETEANQAYFEYYQNNAQRTKYNSNNNPVGWYESSYDVGQAYRFSCVDMYGAPQRTYANGANGISGVAPVFCVK